MLIICRAKEVEEKAAAHAVQAVLSIEHPGAEDGRGRAPRLSGIAQAVLTFWDVEAENVEDGPAEEHLRAAFDFLTEHDGKPIIIHCHAGKSRSTAIALAWLAFNHGIDEAMAMLKTIRPEAAPNIALVNIADKMLGLDGQLTQAVLKDADFTASRAATEQRRRELAQEHPEKLAKLMPEKRK